MLTASINLNISRTISISECNDGYNQTLVLFECIAIKCLTYLFPSPS